eukprot:CAMPEP_0170136000 /NCGR_PEP_ID=MMETSP0033_2-20121228/2901_1 /TAXON_ID=195969 /ORGANISM="Dolichomastix tenuilepis, Strain CCMP3274" /LENGTH=187 /DNA_ID=CAMNT_0010371649 /DNA_START=18 /DNA_END=578 /DNA_ORIENTATION=-
MVDPELMMMPVTADWDSTFFDPRPRTGGNAYSNPDEVPDDGFFTSVDYAGAFSQMNLWLTGLSWLDANGKIPRNMWTDKQLCGDVTSSQSVSGEVFMTCQTFVKSGVTLTIGAGTTIYAYADDGEGLAPALVIEQGASIVAEGTASAPITMTSVVDPAHLPKRGLWGGLIINGYAPIAGGPTDSVEG